MMLDLSTGIERPATSPRAVAPPRAPGVPGVGGAGFPVGPPLAGDAPGPPPTPAAWQRLYDGFVDTGSPRSVSTWFRSRRWRLLLRRFGELDTMKVLDLGGTVESWSVAPVRPAHLTIVNRDRPREPLPANTTFVAGDVCALRSPITGQHWDLVFANSVIEHLGGHERRVAFAAAVRDLAPHHWVQTPNRYFPVEPHFLFPGLQFLPPSARAAVIDEWPLNRWRPHDRRAAMRSALELELIGRAELSFHFPDSAIVDERLGPLTKSLVATR